MRSRSRKERRSRHKSHTTHSSHLSCTYSIHLSPPILFAAFDVSIFRLKFGDQIMTPMRDVFGIHTDELLDFGLMRRIADSGHTRIPVLTAAGAVGSAAVRAELTAGSLAHCSPISPPHKSQPVLPMYHRVYFHREISLSLQSLTAASLCSLSLQPLTAASHCSLSLRPLTAVSHCTHFPVTLPPFLPFPPISLIDHSVLSALSNLTKPRASVDQGPHLDGPGGRDACG